MVTEPTVLIIGAGGSSPYGFPSGNALTKKIISELGNPYHSHLGKILLDAGYGEAQLKGLGKELMLSGQRSVDAFLESRQEFMEVGKGAIAAALIPLEREDKLYNSADNDHWYAYLFNRIVENLRRGGANETLTIITFNYDRSLDHFLVTAFEHTFERKDAQLRALLSRLRIIHVHGMLGDLPLYARANQPMRAYQPDVPNSVRTAAAAIRIVHEAGNEDPEFKVARDFLFKASRVCFLGFGYSVVNLQRLVGSGITLKPPGSMLGTCHGMTGAELNDARRLLGHTMDFVSSDWNCLTFLREHMDRIT